jgi:GNAT superfamily N-acetyltransferase
MTDTAPPATVRWARESDAPQLARLLLRLGWFAALETLGAEKLEEKIRCQLASVSDSSRTTLVAQDAEGTVLGYCNVHWLAELFLAGPEGYVSELFLRPEARGRGVGSALLAHVISEAGTRAHGQLRVPDHAALTVSPPLSGRFPRGGPAPFNAANGRARGVGGGPGDPSGHSEVHFEVEDPFVR